MDSTEPESADSLTTKPLVTYLVIALCAAIFIFFNVSPPPALYRMVSNALAPTSVAIWHGAWWGLLTTNFVHIAFWHVLFNMWWTRDFGRLLEPHLGHVRYLGFILLASIVSACSQILVTGNTGIGFSGVVYAFFGYALLRRDIPAFKNFLTSEVIKWLLGWLLLCIVLTATNVWNVGNGAHVGGFVFGCGIAMLRRGSEWAPRGRILLAALAVTSMLACSYMPWNVYWQYRASYYEAEQIRRGYENGDLTSTLRWGSYLMQYDSSRQQGLSILREAAKGRDPSALNQLSWTLSTSTDSSIRNGAEALQLAQEACKIDGQPNNLDTLAACYAELDRWSEAIETEKAALQKVPSSDETTRKLLRDRIVQLQAHKKVRQ